MTVIPPIVAMLRDQIARWNRASDAGDLDETRRVGAELTGTVEALLSEHDARGGESE